MLQACLKAENLGGRVVLGGDNVPPLVEIGLTDLPKTGGAYAPPLPPPLKHAWYVYGTPEKMRAAWPRLKLYNFNISIL